jgi:hypothetical protein
VGFGLEDFSQVLGLDSDFAGNFGFNETDFMKGLISRKSILDER